MSQSQLLIESLIKPTEIPYLDRTSLDCVKPDQCFTTWNSHLNGISTKDSITEWDVTKIFEECSSLGSKSECVCVSKCWRKDFWLIEGVTLEPPAKYQHYSLQHMRRTWRTEVRQVELLNFPLFPGGSFLRKAIKCRSIKHEYKSISEPINMMGLPLPIRQQLSPQHPSGVASALLLTEQYGSDKKWIRWCYQSC